MRCTLLISLLALAVPAPALAGTRSAGAAGESDRRDVLAWATDAVPWVHGYRVRVFAETAYDCPPVSQAAQGVRCSPFRTVTIVAHRGDGSFQEHVLRAEKRGAPVFTRTPDRSARADLRPFGSLDMRLSKSARPSRCGPGRRSRAVLRGHLAVRFGAHGPTFSARALPATVYTAPWRFRLCSPGHRVASTAETSFSGYSLRPFVSAAGALDHGPGGFAHELDYLPFSARPYTELAVRGGRPGAVAGASALAYLKSTSTAFIGHRIVARSRERRLLSVARDRGNARATGIGPALAGVLRFTATRVRPCEATGRISGSIFARFDFIGRRRIVAGGRTATLDSLVRPATGCG